MAMFSKRHYEVVANVLSVSKDERLTILGLQALLTRMFTADNPRFDAERFNKACEPRGGRE